MEQDCLFCKIIKGEIPSHKVFESEHSYAFLDIYPITEGMTLVIPKKHNADWLDMDEAGHASLMHDVRHVAQMLKKHYINKRIGIQVEGLDVAHVHIKLLPFTSPHEFRAWPDRSKQPDHQALTKIADSLTNN